MEPASALHFMSFRKNPRPGQREAFEALVKHRERLSVQLPTGYGKTFTCCGIYSILKHDGRVTRLLVIFPTDSQLEQFVRDAPNDDLPNAVVNGPHNVVDLRSAGYGAIRDHRNNNRQIFVTTIQSLIQPFGGGVVAELLKTGLWMVCIDEHHHYGENKAWGQAALALPRAYLLVMSATPHRPDRDGAFGAPDIHISYEDAQKDGAVKLLLGHAYHYQLEVEEGGTIRQYTTGDLAALAGGDEPDKIERLRINRKMRWASKFISPLVSIPIERMRAERLTTGFKLQTLITAMCVSHAEHICDQVRDMNPDLRVDWIGTGDWGRDRETNRAVLARFCPSKDAEGHRPEPDLDVLVHVGMAGEGLDSILVSEVVHLARSSLCNRTNQINGRAARYLEGVVAHINFDSSSEFAEKGYVGKSVMKAMDLLPPDPGEDDDQGPPTPPDDDLPPEPPDEPKINILNLEFVGIDSGDAGVQAFARFMQATAPTLFDWATVLADGQHPDWEKVIDGYRKMREREAEQRNDKEILAQWNDSVQLLLSQVVGVVVALMRREGLLIDKHVIGRIKHRINLHKLKAHGELNKQNRHIETARAHYGWLKQLDTELRQQGIPRWLRF